MTTLAAALGALAPDERREALSGLSGADLAALEYVWPLWARPDQLPPPGNWRTWLLLGGRGSGKTRSAAEWVRAEIETGRRRSVAIIGPTADTIRRDAIQGMSGLLAVSAPWCRPSYEPSQRRVVWPNGAIAHLLSSEEPDRIRGPNFDAFWGDEMTSWANAEDCWSNLQFALRVPGPLGHAPAGVVSTTPKRQALLRSVMADPATAITRSRTSDNHLNLDAGTLAYLDRRYGGTTLGRQELDAELLDDVEGALWSRAMLDSSRVPADPDRQYRRVVVAIDPAGGSKAGNAETGIVVAGVGLDGHAYIIRDLSGRFTPQGWARTAVNAYEDHKADRIVAERNFGGETVESTIRSVAPNVPVRMVNASRGKAARAEPVAALAEQGRVHMAGHHAALEDQLCSWNPMAGEASPDRLDALVWAVTDLLLGAPAHRTFIHRLPY